ncbi:MAG: FAD:protein FMN transferase [candidate division Zixibacteria bacterium]|nr:FAD:protein FMN transferase [candidate division Zixibacteria bacterium]
MAQLRKIPIIICFAVTIILLSCSEKGVDRNLIVISGQTMGTGYEVKIVTAEAISKQRFLEVKNGIDSLLGVVNQQMSIYIDSSEITLFNCFKKTDWFPVSTETAEIFKQSLEVSKKSGGAFDITVGPLVNLWGFGPEEKDTNMPNEDSIAQVMRLTGYRKISAKLSPPSIRKKVPDVYCDLAAIAKGYGVDRIAEYLEFNGISDYLVEIGGEIRARGRNQQDTVWQIGIAVPKNELGVQTVIPLNNLSMATSGDYRFYFERKGIRYSHIINPRTGKPITHKLASATVIHTNCSYADAMATAIIVLGPEDGYKLAQRENLPVLLIIRENDDFVEKMTPAFKKYLVPGEQRNNH